MTAAGKTWRQRHSTAKHAQKVMFCQALTIGTVRISVTNSSHCKEIPDPACAFCIAALRERPLCKRSIQSIFNATKRMGRDVDMT